MAADINQFLHEYILGQDVGAILVVSWRLPEAFTCYSGPLTFLGVTPAAEVVASSDYEAHIRQNGPELAAVLDRQTEGDCRRYGLIYLDADHGIQTLVHQINAAVKMASPEAVFILPGAAPPQRGMATSSPTQDWWVGDVWTLVQILSDAGAKVQTAAIPSVGVLIATGVQPLIASNAIASAHRLQSSIQTDEEFHAYFAHADLGSVATRLDVAFGRGRDFERIRIIVDPSEPDIVTSHIIDPQIKWDRPPPQFVHDLSGKNLPVDVLYNRDRSIHGVKVDEFRDVFVYGRDIVLAGSEAAGSVNYYGKNSMASVANSTLKQISSEDDTQDDVSTSITLVDGRFNLPRRRLGEATQLDTPVFTGTPDEYLNFGMWLLYSVPGVKLFKERRADYPKFLAYMERPWQRQMLLDFGIEADELIEQRPDKIYIAPQLATMRQSYRSLSLSKSDMEAFDELGDKACHQGQSFPERLFISRLSHTKNGAYRGLADEEALIDRLTDLGFHAIEPERYSILTQARMFREAKVIVGLGGANMFNVAFCRPGAMIIDIESGMGFVDAHAGLFASRGVEYGIIIGQIDDADPSTLQKRWRLNVDRAAQIISAF